MLSTMERRPAPRVAYAFHFSGTSQTARDFFSGGCKAEPDIRRLFHVAKCALAATAYPCNSVSFSAFPLARFESLCMGSMTAEHLSTCAGDSLFRPEEPSPAPPTLGDLQCVVLTSDSPLDLSAFAEGLAKSWRVGFLFACALDMNEALTRMLYLDIADTVLTVFPGQRFARGVQFEHYSNVLQRFLSLNHFEEVAQQVDELIFSGHLTEKQLDELLRPLRRGI